MMNVLSYLLSLQFRYGYEVLTRMLCEIHRLPISVKIAANAINQNVCLSRVVFTEQRVGCQMSNGF